MTSQTNVTFFLSGRSLLQQIARFCVINVAAKVARPPCARTAQIAQNQGRRLRKYVHLSLHRRSAFVLATRVATFVHDFLPVYNVTATRALIAVLPGLKAHFYEPL